MSGRYFEDFAIGETFESPARTLTRDESLAFARDYDPQPFHLDDEQAKRSFFKQLVSSGWQTAALTMRLVIDSGALEATGILGTGIDELRWLAPVKPGDTLHVRGEVVERLPWPGSISRGILRVRMQTINQEQVTVMSQIANLMMPCRPATVRLYRPVGPAELQLITESGFTQFPPRLSEQPIFYPVCTQQYAQEIASKWNVHESGSGYVTAFDVDKKYLDRYHVRQAGNTNHNEYWIPAADLPEFNAHILGKIQILQAYHA